MKRILMAFALTGIMIFGGTQTICAQDEVSATQQEATTMGANTAGNSGAAAAANETVSVKVKEKFVEGNPFYMGLVAFALVVGLSFCIERIIYLNLSEIDTRRLLEDVELALEKGNVDAAKEICRNTRGPVASICYDGLMRIEQGAEAVDKAVTSSGSVQLGQLERNCSWISLFIKLAPALGFLGTVVGMVQAFDNVQLEGSISPAVIAGGMKVALLTTVFGLLASVILQVFYNYVLSKVESLTHEMEESTNSLIDFVIKYNMKYRQ
jgi:biopolymer transport protein ExbB